MKEYEVVNAFSWVRLSHKPILIKLKGYKWSTSRLPLLSAYCLFSLPLTFVIALCHGVLFSLIAFGAQWLMSSGFWSTQLFPAALAPYAHVTPPRAPISHFSVGESSRAWQPLFCKGIVPLGFLGDQVATAYSSFAEAQCDGIHLVQFWRPHTSRNCHVSGFPGKLFKHNWKLTFLKNKNTLFLFCAYFKSKFAL